MYTYIMYIYVGQKIRDFEFSVFWLEDIDRHVSINSVVQWFLHSKNKSDEREIYSGAIFSLIQLI